MSGSVVSSIVRTTTVTPSVWFKLKSLGGPIDLVNTTTTAFDETLGVVCELVNHVEWRRNGRTHNDEGPAVIFDGGYCMKWVQNDVFHRDPIDGIDQPAYIEGELRFMYFQRGKPHRDLDLPAYECYLYGSREWYKYGEMVRYSSMEPDDNDIEAASPIDEHD